MRWFSGRQLALVGGVVGALAAVGGALAGWSAARATETVPAPVASELPFAAAISGRDNAGTATILPAQFLPAGERPAGFDDEANNIAIYQRFNPAVVNITALTIEYNPFLDAVPRSGTGSGTIIDHAGHILTNYHVIKDARELTITLASGAELAGVLVGIDPENDLAVVKIDPAGQQLATLPLGKSAELLVGQKVLAIGNPFGLSRTLTTGVVSGLGRPVRTDAGGIIQQMIQTDASINPGNSGGPLLNSSGEMIGINTTIISPSGGSVGIGFAVPIDTARRVLPELLSTGQVRRGWIDLRPIQLTPRLARQLSVPIAVGLLVSEVDRGGNAAAAGIRGGSRAVRIGRSVFRLGGDVIVAVDGIEVSTIANLFNALEDNKPGDRVQVVYFRGTQRRTATLTLSERSQQIRDYFS
jgi:S1-C subfamily serine protease